MRYHRAPYLFLCLLLLVSSAAAEHSIPGDRVSDPISRVEAAFQEGELSFDEKAMLQIMAIVEPEQLPDKYQVEGLASGVYGSRCATMAIVEIRQNWDVLSADAKNYITKALARPPGAYTYDSPGGFFTMHYDVSGTHAVPSTDGNSNGIPDYVEKCAAYMDTSLTKHRELGYLDPPDDNGAGGDDKFDVYFESMGYYGYADPEGPGPEPWNDYYSYLVLHNNFYGFPPNDDPEGNQAGAAKATAAHEFHHCVQFAYDAGEPTWLMESDAVYMEDIVFDHVNDNYNYLSEFFSSPETSLLTNDFHAYASFGWELYLANRFDTSLMVAIWEGARYDNGFDVIEDTLMGRYGWTQDSAFTEFTYWNYITASRNDGLHHEEADFYPGISIGATHSIYPVSVGLATRQPAGYASTYIQFYPNSAEGILEISFDGSNVREWQAYIVKSPSVNVHSMEMIELSPSYYEGTIQIPAFESYYSIALVVVNTEEGTPGGSFSYSATVVLPELARGEILTDTAAFAGETRLFEYKVVSVTEEGHVFEVHSWDERGWIDSGKVERFVPGGDSTVVEIEVSPSESTPIDTRSELTFRVQAKTQPMAYDENSMDAVIVPKKGDVNRDGKVTLSDITFMISHVYMYTAPPNPPELGDYDCSGSITLSDITQVIDLVYISHVDDSCDPYIR